MVKRVGGIFFAVALIAATGSFVRSASASSGNVHGPGNSQPHKVVTCGHRHGVDVHALTSHAAKGCGSSTPPPTHTPDPPKANDPPVSVTPHGATPHNGSSAPGSKPKTVAD